jgi:predicted nucleic acid-binding Zn ribbon protein
MKSEEHQIASQARRRVEHTCQVCGTTFTAIKTAKFCGNRCRQAWKNEKNRRKAREGMMG